MNIAILRLSPDQKIPRPFSRASSYEEMAELIGHWVGFNSTGGQGGYSAKHKAAKRFSEDYRINYTSALLLANIDTETPVLAINGTKFYAFTEE